MGRSTLKLVKLKTYVRAFSLAALTAPIVFSYQNCGRQNLSKALTSINQSSKMEPKDCGFNNAIIKHGESVLAYQASQVGYGQSCISETRTCTNAKLSGTYQNATCNVQPGINCALGGTTVLHNNTVTAYSAATVAYNQSCSSISRQIQCVNGSFAIDDPAGNYIFSTCAVGQPPALTCLFGGVTYSEGQTINAFTQNEVPYGSSCDNVKISFSCNSSFSSQAVGKFSTCSVKAPTQCTLGANTVSQPNFIKAYERLTVPYGQECKSQDRYCTATGLDGTYQFTSCTVEEQPFNEKLLASLDANKNLDFRIPRSELEPTLRKGCICIDCSVDETNRAAAMGCKYIRWANYPWVFLGQIPSEGKPYYYPNIARGWLDARNLTTTNEHWSLFPLIQDKTIDNPELPAKDQKIKNTNVYFEAGIPEFATNGISNLELTADEITIVRKLTDLYHPNPSSISISATPFNNFDNLVAPATMYMWWGQGDPATSFTKNGAPSLITQEGWIYHVFMGYRMIDSGAGAISLPQINLRLFGKQNPTPEQKQQGQLVVAAYIKAMKAYAKARWNRKLPFVTESIVSIFSSPQDIAPLIDLVKYQADTDLAVGGKVSSYNNNQSFDCLNPELILGDAKEVSGGSFDGYRYGQLCLAKNEGDFIRSFQTSGGVGHPNFSTVNNFGIPISLELDGCMDCNPTNPNHIIHIYKRAGDTSYEALSSCSSYIRNGLTTNAQFFTLPDEQRRNTLIYMDKVTRILTQQKQNPIFFMPPLRLDQNHIPALYLNNQGTPASSTNQLSAPYNAYSLEQWNFQKNMIRYCPQNESAPGRPFSIQEISFRSYSAQNCSDDATIENILKDRAYQTRSSLDFIKQAYQQILKREATAKEVISFSNTCKVAGPAAVVSTLLQTLVNGVFMQNTPDEVITAVYTTLLNRNPDSFGLTYWRDWATANNRNVDQLRAELPFIFSGSDEFKKNHLILGCQ